MRLLFLSKRRPQQRDLVERPYGRFFHLPRLLALAGHDVHLALLDHRGGESLAFSRDGLAWTSHGIGLPFPPRGLRDLAATARAFRPDWIIGCSDAWVGVIAHRLAASQQCRLAIDAYDNYEAYMPWNKPLHVLWRRAIARADASIAAGPQLAARMDSSRPRGTPTTVVPMAADPGFAPMPMGEARARLGLPADRPILGYSGGWAANRGTEILLPAFRRIREALPDALMLLTGRPPVEATSEPGVACLGYVPDDWLPGVVNAANACAVVTTPGAFGDFSYPAKLYEALACRRPVVATSTGPVRWILNGDEKRLVPPGSVEAFAGKVLAFLTQGAPGGEAMPGWEHSASALEAALRGAATPLTA